jgi:hypothetical protein
MISSELSDAVAAGVIGLFCFVLGFTVRGWIVPVSKEHIEEFRKWGGR